MKNFVEYIVKCFIEHNIISKEMENIYRYGLEMLILATLEIKRILLIGLATGNSVETIVFSVCLFAGGYHATIQLRCYLYIVGSLYFV